MASIPLLFGNLRPDSLIIYNVCRSCVLHVDCEKNATDKKKSLRILLSFFAEIFMNLVPY